MGYSHARVKHGNRSRGERSEQVTCGHVTREGVGHCLFVQRWAGAVQHCVTMAVKLVLPGDD